MENDSKEVVVLCEEMCKNGDVSQKGKDLMATNACIACEMRKKERERAMDPVLQKNSGNKQ